MASSHPLQDHLEKLHYFVAVSEAGSLAKAAEKISISQPSLSRAMKILEESLGVTLFVRGSKGLELTAAGKRLFEQSRELLLQVARIEAEIQRGDPELTHLEIGTKEPYAVHLWPGYLRRLRERFPRLEFSLLVRRTNVELAAELAAGKLRLIMIPNPKPQENVVAFELFSDPMALFAAEGAITASSKIFVFGEGMCGAGKSLDDVIEERGGDKGRYVRVGSHEVAKALAEGGLGIALLSAWMGEKSNLLRVTDDAIDPKWFGIMKVCVCVHERDARHPRIKEVIRELRALYRNRPMTTK